MQNKMNEAENSFIENIKKRKSDKLKVEPVFHNDSLELEVINYLKKQKYLDFSRINFFFKNKFADDFPFGYILKNEFNHIVGFLGTMFCNKDDNGSMYTYCNLHTWIVDEVYRINSYMLLLPLIEKKIVITTFTPIKTLVGLYKKFGFDHLQMKYRVVFLFNLFNFFKRQRYEIETDELKIKKILNKKDLKIYEDHYNLSCFKFIIVDKYDSSNNIFVVATKNKKKYFFIFDLIYVSNKEKFREVWSDLCSVIAKKYRVLFFGQHFLKPNETLIPKKFFTSREIQTSICVKNLPKRFNFDTLYSEFIY